MRVENEGYPATTRPKELRMARSQHTRPLASLEEAVTVLFCLVDYAYRLLNPSWRSHEPLDIAVLPLALKTSF